MITPPTVTGDPDVRARLARSLRSPSGRAVMAVLAGQPDQTMTARQIADAAGCSPTAVREQAYRASCLGYLVQESVGTMPPTAVWRITSTGRLYVDPKIGASQ